jgi:hypothetical protein
VEPSLPENEVTDMQIEAGEEAGSAQGCTGAQMVEPPSAQEAIEIQQNAVGR